MRDRTSGRFLEGRLILIHGGPIQVLWFPFECAADMAPDGAGKFGEETLDKVEPGARLRV